MRPELSARANDSITYAIHCRCPHEIKLRVLSSSWVVLCFSGCMCTVRVSELDPAGHAHARSDHSSVAYARPSRKSLDTSVIIDDHLCQRRGWQNTQWKYRDHVVRLRRLFIQHTYKCSHSYVRTLKDPCHTLELATKVPESLPNRMFLKGGASSSVWTR